MWSRLLTGLVSVMTGARLRDIGCPFNACTLEVARTVSTFGELRRFLKPLALRVSRRVAEVEVTHQPRHRQRPKSSYSATGLIRLFMDFFVNTAGDIFAWIFVGAVALTAIGGLPTLAAIVLASLGRTTWMPAILASSATLICGAASLTSLAGDYVQRIYRQSSGRPFYLVRAIHSSTAYHTAHPDALVGDPPSHSAVERAVVEERG